MNAPAAPAHSEPRWACLVRVGPELEGTEREKHLALMERILKVSGYVAAPHEGALWVLVSGERGPPVT